MPISENSMNLMPSESLVSLSNLQAALQAALEARLSTLETREARLSKQVSYTNTVNGRQTVEMKERKATENQAADAAAGAAATANLAKTLSDGGQEAYDPESLPEGTEADEGAIESLVNDVEGFIEDYNLDTISTAISILSQLAGLAGSIASTSTDLAAAKSTQDDINNVLEKRAAGELPEPILNTPALEEAFNQILSDLSQNLTEDETHQLEDSMQQALTTDSDKYTKFVQDNIVKPFAENKAAIAAVRAQLFKTEPKNDSEPIFDLVYGPPLATSHRFVLSEDGIYYDSRSGGIPAIFTKTITSNYWKLQFGANKGGRGVEYSDEQYDKFSETIFSDSFTDTNDKVKAFYLYDDILNSYTQDRKLQLQDVSGTIVDLMSVSGYAASSAMVKNYQEAIGSVSYAYDEKIKVRKKQLQLAALFGPYEVTDETHALGPGHFLKLKVIPLLNQSPICGSDIPGTTDFSEGTGLSGVDETTTSGSTTFTPFRSLENIERIPINDFSYLKLSALIPSIDVQARFTLMSSDLDDVVNPYPPTYLTEPVKGISLIPELAINPLGENKWVDASGDNFLSSTTPALRNLDDEVITSNLLCSYNFLDPLAVVTAPEHRFLVRNHAETSTALNAKLVGSTSSIFVSGLSIPYLNGTLVNAGKKYGIRYDNIPEGSYVRLPSNIRNNDVYPPSDPLDNLMYSESGWSFDFWTYTPSLSSTLTYDHRYKVIIANENNGDASVPTKGMLIGFRDRGYPGTAPSGLEFVVLGTEPSDAVTWGKSVVIGAELSGVGSTIDCYAERGLVIGLDTSTVSGKNILNSNIEFTHYNISHDVASDVLTVTLDGEFLASATASTAFGTKKNAPLNLPGRMSTTSYQDGDGVWGEKLYNRHLYPSFPIFTPWVIGGGWTDNIYEANQINKVPAGFLGANTNAGYNNQSFTSNKGGFIGQHTNSTVVPGLAGYKVAHFSVNYKIPRSGLEGFVGSFKIYTSPLNTEEVLVNYKAQQAYFKNITTNPPRIL